MPYEMPGELEEDIRAFIDYYNYRRYHEGLGDVTPYDVYVAKYLEVIQRRKEAKNRTLQEIRDYNRAVREQGIGLNCPTFADHIQINHFPARMYVLCTVVSCPIYWR